MLERGGVNEFDVGVVDVGVQVVDISGEVVDVGCVWEKRSYCVWGLKVKE